MNGNGAYAPGEDATGRKRIVWNILASWGGHMVFIVAGFLMPRIIDRHVGQASLGIWDFSWTMVSYVGLAGLGIGSSINRYVARFRAAGDKAGLDEAVSSVICAQIVTATAYAVLTAALLYFLPHFLKGSTAEELSDARWVFGLLGAVIVVQELNDAYRGVITGCHRWDLHNAINAVSYGIIVLFMILSLSMGYGLRSLAAVYLCGTVATEVCRYFIARRICPELEVGVGKASWKQAREMVGFGIKTIVAGLPGLVILQGTSLLITWHLGPAMLAVFSRPLGLITNAQTFITKYALVLTPTAGSMQGAGMDEEIRELMIRTMRYGVALSLPMVIFFTILGGPILRLWMGPRYDVGIIMALIAAGTFLRMSQTSSLTILVGLNAHGPIG
ncbi:MAG: oligosaccharide flippase family protein, partial [Proteobacteria bacterium]|nr:oligosaccharide flippase family protein [Pseudomonadota bacterium]